MLNSNTLVEADFDVFNSEPRLDVELLNQPFFGNTKHSRKC